MLLAEEIRGLVKTVLSQDDLLSFERVLESAPEVYDYSGVMTYEAPLADAHARYFLKNTNLTNLTNDD